MGYNSLLAILKLVDFQRVYEIILRLKHQKVIWSQVAN